jgi:non-heme chloroperoxidase
LLGFAFYSGERGAMALTIDANELQRELDVLKLPQSAGPPLKETVRELLQRVIPDVERDLEDLQRNLQALPDTTAAPDQAPLMYSDQVDVAMARGEQKYTQLSCPILAFFSGGSSQGMQTGVGPVRAVGTQLPSARVVRLRNADHYVYRSHEAEVEQAMNAFMDGLPPGH